MNVIYGGVTPPHVVGIEFTQHEADSLARGPDDYDYDEICSELGDILKDAGYGCSRFLVKGSFSVEITFEVEVDAVDEDEAGDLVANALRTDESVIAEGVDFDTHDANLEVICVDADTGLGGYDIDGVNPVDR